MEGFPRNLFALLIGINNYASHDIPHLRGAVADARAFGTYLQHQLSIPQNHITTLENESATRAAILGELRHFAHDPRIRRGDPIVIFFAGHGRRAAGGPNATMDVTWPYDVCCKVGGATVAPIEDHTLGAVLEEIAQEKGNNIVVIMDCCRSDDSKNKVRVRLVRAVPPPSNLRFQGPLDKEIEPVPPINGIPRSHVLLSACEPYGSASESDGRGIFTAALLDLLHDSQIDKLRYCDIVMRLNIDSGFKQTPTCEGAYRERYIFTACNSSGQGREADGQSETQICASEPQGIERIPGMFGHAHDFSITGGQFYSVEGDMSIDASQDASTQSIHISQYYARPHYIVLSTKVDGQQESQIQGNESNDPLFSTTTSRLDEDRTTDNGDALETCPDDAAQCLYPEVEIFCSLGLSDSLPEEDDTQSENQQPHSIQSTVVTSSPSSPIQELLIDKYFLLDEIIYDVLSRYPTSPTGDVRSFQRIIAALLVSFSPLSPAMLTVLFGLDSPERVKQILLPASAFLVRPDSGKHNANNYDLAPVRFIDSSTAGFFLERKRSQQYYVDTRAAHKILLDACTRVMTSDYPERPKLARVRRGWRDAYEYACRNWERHRSSAGAEYGRIKSKL